MTKPINTKYAMTRLDHLAQSLNIDNLTQTIIHRARKDSPLPDEFMNDAQNEALRFGREACVQDFERLTDASSEHEERLLKIRIDITAPDEIESQYKVGLKRIISEQADSYNREKSELSDLRKSFNDYRNTRGISREPRIGNKSKALVWTIVFFLIEGIFNAIQLFTGGILPGGLIGAVAISFLVGAVNALAAYLVGEHIWKYTKGVNHHEEH